MKKIILTLALFFCLTTTAYATELLMFSMKSCGYCRSFLQEVAQEYKNTEHAKLLPLRIISMDRPQAPEWFDEAFNRQAIDGIRGTPTFIIFDGQEVARLVGYTGKDKFYADIARFIKGNKSQLEARVGENRIPYDKETEMTPEQALTESLEASPDRTNKSEEPTNDKPIGPMNEFGDARVPPPGVIDSRDLFTHMYKTAEEAVKASHWFGCHGTIHYHEKENVWMPCSMN
jgi:thioredoxin-related protein